MTPHKQAPVEPSAMVLVPREPTPEIIAVMRGCESGQTLMTPKQAWSAMLAAAPSAPAADAVSVEEIARLTREMDQLRNYREMDAAHVRACEDAMMREKARADALAKEVEALKAALGICDRVLHSDLHRMITWGDDYNQVVKDAADAARRALAGGRDGE